MEGVCAQFISEGPDAEWSRVGGLLRHHYSNRGSPCWHQSNDQLLRSFSLKA